MCRNYVRMDGWVQDDVLTTWHLHLAFSWETIPSEYKMGNLIGYICPGMKQMCNVEISQTPTQWNSKCSKLFNLKADGGTTNKKVHNQRVGKKRKRQANSCKSDKRTAKKAQKTHNQKQKKSDSVPSFWTMLNLKKSKRELSPAHIKRGYSGPGHLGGFVVVSLCDAWGLPQFSNMLHWLKTMIEDLYALSCMMYSIKKEVTCICCTYKIFVCTKFYVQIIFVCTKKYFTWYFKNLLLLCLDSSKNLWIAFLKQADTRCNKIRVRNQCW